MPSRVILIAIIFLTNNQMRLLCPAAPVYMGCFKNFLILTEAPLAVQSATFCLEACSGHLIHFVGIRDGMACYCGNITLSRTLTSNCDLPCATGGEMCGGVGFYSVFSDVPVYVGCFVHELAGVCYRSCSENGYDTLSQRLRHCTCSISDYEGRTNLTRTCLADCLVSMSCERIPIFSVNFFPGLNKRFTDIFHCNNEVVSSDGECTVARCKPGWKGARCAQRDCNVNNGDCGEHQCSLTSFGGAHISECLCKKGLTQSLTLFETCMDVDECAENPCMEATENCINTFKSYMCVCAPKHVVAKCDTEHCSKQLFTCNDTDCHRVKGFFKCRPQRAKSVKSTNKLSNKGAQLPGNVSLGSLESLAYLSVGVIVCGIAFLAIKAIGKKRSANLSITGSVIGETDGTSSRKESERSFDQTNK